MAEKLTKAQRDLIIRMGFVPDALRNCDECVPKWWIEGGAGVKANVADSVVKRGWVRLTGHWGGQPGLLGFTVTAAGRAALQPPTPSSDRLADERSARAAPNPTSGDQTNG